MTCFLSTTQVPSKNSLSPEKKIEFKTAEEIEIMNFIEKEDTKTPSVYDYDSKLTAKSILSEFQRRKKIK